VSEPAASQRPERSGFAAHRDAIVHAWSGHVATIGITLVPLFLFLDWLTMPPALHGRFAWYRATVTAALCAQLLLIRKTRPRRLSFLHGYAITLLVGGAIGWMTVDLGGFDSSYYAGLNLVTVAVGLLLPWRPIHTALSGTLVVVMYVMLNVGWGGPFHVPLLVNHLYFMCSTVIIAVAISAVKYGYVEKEFRAREELTRTNADLDRSRRELAAARDALWGEMEVAKRIQTALLPHCGRAGPWDIAARMQPADEVGGDYYDIIRTPGGQGWVAIGDVSGHGVESGLVMMMTQTSILALIQENPGLGPAGVFRAVNDVLMENIGRLGTGRYMTLNLVRLHDDRLIVAGKHQDILIWRRASGRVEAVTNQGSWIGLSRDLNGEVTDRELLMDEGDVALFFTDGATEAMSPAGEMFGDDRLAAALARVAERPPPEALDALFAEVAAFRGRQEDDVTMMLLRLG
jgi:phosphoserine phosphatase RsbU/P